eukprot:Pompholyxophrys_punicea_v1_NODE_188_length_2887_cov_6.109463.p2 type:complete len:269 gc:universal NODE_188_length_2887_cov_6.109463:964-158(-)
MPPTPELLTAVIEKDEHNKLLMSMGAEAKARILSCGAPGSGAWLQTLPVTSELRLSDREFRCALRLRLGLSPNPAPALPPLCICGHEVSRPSHYVACHALKRTLLTTRHDRQTALLQELAVMAGCSTLREPRLGSGEQRADLLITFPDGRMVYTDTQVVSPEEPTYISTSQTELGAARMSAQRKRRLYHGHVSNVGAAFTPMIWEVYGGLLQESSLLIHQLVALAADRYGHDSSALAWLHKCKTAVTPQRDNAHAMLFIEGHRGAAVR